MHLAGSNNQALTHFKALPAHMTGDKGWKLTARLAPSVLCDAAAEEFRNSGNPSELLNHADSKCSALLRHIFKVRAMYSSTMNKWLTSFLD